MNFFTLGYAFLVIHLNMGWASNYILKLAGILFMLGGISEISYFSKMFAGLKKRAYISLAVSASSCLIVSCFKLMELGGALFSAVSVIAGTASVLAAFIFLRDLMNLLVQNNFLVNDASNISRLCSSWQKLAFFTAVNILFDILNRIVPVTAIADFAGVMMTVTKIVLFVFVISTVWTFNKIRCDFNNKHPDGTDASDE